MILPLVDHYALALAVTAFVPGYLAGAKLKHPHAPLLVGFVGGCVVYLAAKALIALAVYVALPVLLLVLYLRFHDDVRHWGQIFASESGIRLRQLRRPAHVNDAIDRLLGRRDVVNRELTLLKDSGGRQRHTEQRLREELSAIDRTLEDLL